MGDGGKGTWVRDSTQVLFCYRELPIIVMYVPDHTMTGEIETMQ